MLHSNFFIFIKQNTFSIKNAFESSSSPLSKAFSLFLLRVIHSINQCMSQLLQNRFHSLQSHLKKSKKSKKDKSKPIFNSNLTREIVNKTLIHGLNSIKVVE